MRKAIAIFAAAAMLMASLTACSSDNERQPEDSPGTSSTPADEQPDEGGEDGSDEGSDSGEGDGSDKEESSDDSEDGAVQKILEEIKKAYGDDYIPNTEIPEDVLRSMYGLDPDTYTEVAAEMPMISANVDTVIIVKAANGKTGDVKAALNAYHDRLVNESVQYPINVAKVNAAQVAANGDYVAFIMLGAIDGREGVSDSDRAEFAQEQIKIGVDAFNDYFD